MAFVKKTWKDRIVQYANRRLLTKSGGEVEQVTVTRDEGTIYEEGDKFNASNMNDLEQRISDVLDYDNTASGSLIHITDGADNIPVSSFECDIGSAGFSQADITVCGKNFYSVKVGRDLFANNRGATHTTNNDILSITMASENNSGVYGGTGGALDNVICQTIKKFSGSFVLSLYAKSSIGNKDVYFGFGSFGNKIVTLTTSWQRVELPLTLDSAIHVLNFYNRSGSEITVDIKDLQLELGSTATTYEEYKGNTYTVEFGSTFNDGVLKYENGAWSIDVSGVITPITSSTRIKTISGENNIFSNTGDVTVDYYTDNADDILNFIHGEIDKIAYKSGEVVFSNYITGAYISGSGNYVEFCIPINTNATSGTITNLGTTLNVFIGSTRLTNEVTLSDSSVVAIKDGYAQIELKLNSTQTANSVATVSLDGFTVDFE